MFEIFEHTADLGLRVRAADRRELFVEAARALCSVLVANPDRIRAVLEKELAIEGRADDYLLFDWLSELLYLFDAERIAFSEFQVEFVGGGLRATCRGEPIDPARHALDHEVKAITYHGLRMEQTADGWLAEVIVDI